MGPGCLANLSWCIKGYVLHPVLDAEEDPFWRCEVDTYLPMWLYLSLHFSLLFQSQFWCLCSPLMWSEPNALAREQRRLATVAYDNPKIKRLERDWPEARIL